MDQGEPLDTMAPWTIKALPTRTRETITTAARREGLTVGQWLERRVAEWEGQGSPMPVAAPASHSLGDLAQAMHAVQAVAGAAGVAVPEAFARDALLTVRRAMREARGLSVRRPPQRALAHAPGNGKDQPQ
jgi:hypothetical protein